MYNPLRRIVIHIVLVLFTVNAVLSQEPQVNDYEEVGVVATEDSVAVPFQDASVDSLMALSMDASGSKLAGIYYELSLALQDLDSDSALYYANQAEIILTKNDPNLLLPYLFKRKGKIYEKRMANDRSLVYYRKAYEEFIKADNQQEIGSCALSIGNILYELADFSEAYYFYLQSLNAYEKANDYRGIAMMENNLGTVSHEMGKLDEAKNHYQRAYEIYHENGYVIDECQALNNIGLILYDNQLYDSSLVYFQTVLEIMDSIKVINEESQYVLSAVYNNMALAYGDMGDHSLALDYLRKGLSIARSIDDQFNLGSVYTNLGSLFGVMRQQDSALFYLHRALRIAKQHGFKHLELDTYQELAVLHANIGNYASAYNWHLRYDTVYKAVFNENQAAQMARQRAHYEQELKDSEIEQLLSDSQVQKTLNKLFLVFIVVIVALSLIIAINLRSKKTTNRMLAERNLQLSNALQKLSESELELQKLNRSKDRIFTVVAHDLRNPVAAVNGFSELLHDNFDQFTQETQKEYILQILQGTQRIQSLLENMLIWARSQMKAIKYEPEILNVKFVVDACVKELKPNFDHKKVECLVRVERKCEVFADKSMIYTVIRNLLMNAIKFSFPGSKIRVTSENGTEECRIMFADEGIGIQPEIQEKLFDADEAITSPGTTGESGSGLGLVICKEFLERNKGSIGVESEPGNGSTFTVTLPMRDKK
jgi:signal transduction histidine kinase